MNTRYLAIRFVLVVSVLAVARTADAQPTPLGDAFTYQGLLKQGGEPANGGFDLECRLFDAAVNGDQVGSLQTFTDVQVADGLFMLELNFGAGAFAGSNRFLEIRVRPTGSGGFTTLTPRQALLAAPYSLFAKTTALSGTFGGPVSFTNPANSFTGAFTGTGGGITQLNATNVSSGSLNPAHMPTGGNWTPGSLLNIDSGTLALDPVGNRVGVGTTSPNAPLHVVGPDNNGTTAALRIESSGQIMLLDGNEIDSLTAAGLFLNNNAPNDVILASGGGRVGVRTATPVGSLSVGEPGVLNVHVPGDSTCFTPQATPGCSDQGCQNMVCAVDAFCCTTSWDSVCVGEANTLCIGRVGLGTNAAEARLHIAGGTDASLAGGGFIIAGSMTGANLAIDNNEIMARNNGAAGTLAINPDGGNVNILQGGAGNVGIGTSSPAAKLEVQVDSAAVAAFDRFGSDGTIIVFLKNGAAQGSISVSGSTVSYNAFTGSHYGWLASDQSIERFALVRMTGENRRLGSPIPIDRNWGPGEPEAEVIYGVEPTTRANDPACLGAYLGPQNAGDPIRRAPNSDQSELGTPSVRMGTPTLPLGDGRGPHSRFSANGDPNPHLVMAVGNGEMWVIDGGSGDIEPGDFLISSDVPGCAMKHDGDRFPVGYIVARAAQSLEWSVMTADDRGTKRARISVLFENFVRDSGGTESIARRDAEIAALRAHNQALEVRLAALEGRIVERLAAKR